ITTVTASVTTYKDTGLTASTTYYYRVRANNPAGDSGYSNVASDLTSVPAAPGNLGATAVSSSEIDLAWTDNAPGNEAGFLIDRSLDGVTFTQIATVATGVT